MALWPSVARPSGPNRLWQENAAGGWGGVCVFVLGGLQSSTETREALVPEAALTCAESAADCPSTSTRTLQLPTDEPQEPS